MHCGKMVLGYVHATNDDTMHATIAGEVELRAMLESRVAEVKLVRYPYEHVEH